MKYYFLALTILFTVLPLPILSNPSDNNLSTLKIGTMDLRPYGWQDSAGNKHGIIYELNEEIGKRMKIPYVNNIYPFKRMLKLLKDGEIDLISSQAHSQSLKSGDKLAVQFDINVIAGTRKGSNISKISDLKDKQLVYHRSASYTELSGLPKEITRVNSYEQALGVLFKDRHADAAVFSEPAYYYWMKSMGLSPKDFGNIVLVTANKKQWIFVRRNFPEKLKEKLRTVVNEIYLGDSYKKLLYKYGKK